MTEAKQTEAKQSDAGNSKACAVLSYFLIGIVWYFVDDKMKGDTFAKFHVKQALLLLIVSAIGYVALLVMIISIPLIPLFNIAVFIVAIIGIVNAVNGKKKELPIIGQFADKFLKF